MMSDALAPIAFVRTAPEPTLPPPLFSRGAIAWARANLFSSLSSSLLTIVLAALFLWYVPPLIEWATVKAIWSAPDGALCRAHQDGACWAFIAQKADYLRYGSYPAAERWRVDVTEAMGAVLILWLLWPGAPPRENGALFLFVINPKPKILIHLG
jgi:general L-amino acid transport system permease protein